MNKKVLIAAAIAVAIFIAFCCAFTARADENYRPAWEIDSIRYQQYMDILENATDADIEALEQTIFWESQIGDCGYELNCAVIETVLNRVASSNWPNTIYGVCHDKGQFCCKPYKNNKWYLQDKWMMDEAICDAIADEWDGRPYVLSSPKYTFFAKGQQKDFAYDFVFIGYDKKHGMWFGKGKNE